MDMTPGRKRISESERICCTKEGKPGQLRLDPIGERTSLRKSGSVEGRLVGLRYDD